MTADTALQEMLNDVQNSSEFTDADAFRAALLEKGYVIIRADDADILADLSNLIRKGCDVSPDTLKALGRLND